MGTRAEGKLLDASARSRRRFGDGLPPPTPIASSERGSTLPPRITDRSQHPAAFNNTLGTHRPMTEGVQLLAQLSVHGRVSVSGVYAATPHHADGAFSWRPRPPTSGNIPDNARSRSSRAGPVSRTRCQRPCSFSPSTRTRDGLWHSLYADPRSVASGRDPRRSPTAAARIQVRVRPRAGCRAPRPAPAGS